MDLIKNLKRAFSCLKCPYLGRLCSLNEQTSPFFRMKEEGGCLDGVWSCQRFCAGSQVRLMPSFLNILWSTSPSITVEWAWQPSSSDSVSSARQHLSS